MSIKEYIELKLPAFQFNDADFVDFDVEDVNAEYSSHNAKEVGIAMIPFIEELAYRPHLKQINESGFSASWEYDLGKYYMLLCRKYGITPNTDTANLLGINTITILDAADYL